MESYLKSGAIEDDLAKKYIDPNRIRTKDKKDRCTHDKVIDQNVDKIIRTCFNTNTISEIFGCISSGKEANVYAATAFNSSLNSVFTTSNIYTQNTCALAVKIYKTSILDYRNRAKYIEGEFRYKMWNYTQNPRKMVRKWAEKEYRNLIRLNKQGISAPEPIKLRNNVLIMRMLGDTDGPFPQLKVIKNEKDLGEHAFNWLFKEIVFTVRKMYQKCKLVHGDLSEYNILVDLKQIGVINQIDQQNFNIDKISNTNPAFFIIDVSQSVESYSQYASIYLRRDIFNICSFFRKFDIRIPPLKTIFDFIVDPYLDENTLEDLWLENLEIEVNEDYDAFFKEVFIPKNLSEVVNVEEDLENCKIGDFEEITYDGVTGMKQELFLNCDDYSEDSGETSNKDSDGELQIDDENNLENISSKIDSSENKEFIERVILTKDEIRKNRKENKKKVKEENREKRKYKIPKKFKY